MPARARARPRPAGPVERWIGDAEREQRACRRTAQPIDDGHHAGRRGRSVPETIRKTTTAPTKPHATCRQRRPTYAPTTTASAAAVADVDVVGEPGADDPGVALLRRDERGRTGRSSTCSRPQTSERRDRARHGRRRARRDGRRNDDERRRRGRSGTGRATNCDIPMRKRSNGSGKLVEEARARRSRTRRAHPCRRGRGAGRRGRRTQPRPRATAVDRRSLVRRASSVRRCRSAGDSRTPASSSLRRTYVCRRRRRGLACDGRDAVHPATPVRRRAAAGNRCRHRARQAADDVERVVGPEIHARDPVQERRWPMTTMRPVRSR